MYKKLLRTFSIMMIILSMTFLLFENMTGVPSRLLCEELCGKNYLPLLEPKVIDSSCRFYADMYLSFSLVLLFVFGMVITILLGRRSVVEQNDIDESIDGAGYVIEYRPKDSI